MKKIIATLTMFAPAIAFAQAPITDANSLVSKLVSIGNVVIYLLTTFAVIYIIWSVVKFIMAGEGDGRDAAKHSILWGIVGLFVILSIWGLVNILTNTFKTSTTTGQNTVDTRLLPTSNYVPTVQ